MGGTTFTIAAVVMVTAAAVMGWALLEARAFALRHVDVPVLPPGASPIRILHISDIHATPKQAKKLAWVRALGRHDIDLVVNTGDNLAHQDAVPAVLAAFEPLLGVPGVFVYGSNDYFAPRPKNPLTYFRGPSRSQHEPTELPTADLTAGLTGAGWHDLNNARTTVRVSGLDLDFVGMDDPHLGRDDYVPPSPGASPDVTLGVVHAPYVRALERLRANGADVIFAGHTHGGQVCVPGMGALVTNCDLPRRMARGLHGWPGPFSGKDGGTGVWLHVSAGVGTSPFAPIRFACRPEATLVTLVARPVSG